MVALSVPSNGEAVHVHGIWRHIEIEASPDVVFDAVVTAVALAAARPCRVTSWTVPRTARASSLL